MKAYGRYRLLKKIDISAVDLNCPAEIHSGILLFDHVDRKVVLVLKMVNISKEIIRSVYLTVNGLDDTGDPIVGVHPVKKSYLDQNAKPLGLFGSDQSIVLDPRVRNIEINIIKIGKGQTAWRNNVDAAQVYQPQAQPPLSRLGSELESFFLKVVDKKGFQRKTWLKYIPQALEDSWLCSCGRPNSTSDETCVKCGIEKDWIFANTNPGILTTKLNAVKDADRYEAELRQAKEEATALTWKKRRPYIAAALLAVVVTGFLFVENNNKKQLYTNTITAYEKGEYEIAQSGFSLLGGFKDSEEWLEKSIKEPIYNNMLAHYHSDNYDAASPFLSQLGDYKDSAEIRDAINKETAYTRGVDLLSESKYEEAETIFIELGDFRDSPQKLEVARMKFVAPMEFQNALISLQNGNIAQSLEEISLLDPYSNPEVSKEWILEYGKNLYNNGYFLEALPFIEQVQSQLDTTPYLNSNPYNIRGKWQFGKMTIFFSLEENSMIDVRANQGITPFVDINYTWDPGTTNSFSSRYERWLIKELDSESLKLVKQTLNSSGELVEEQLDMTFLEIER